MVETGKGTRLVRNVLVGQLGRSVLVGKVGSNVDFGL